MVQAGSRLAAAWESAARTAAFLGLLTAVALVLSRAHLVTDGERMWHGLFDPPTPLHLAAAAALTAAMMAALWRVPRASRPFAFLLAAALPLVPAFAGHLPLLLAPQGPLLILLAAALAAVVLARASTLLPRPALPLPASVLLIAPFLVYMALGQRLPGPAGPQGDEPHYLVMAQSLVCDGDLDLADEFRDREYASFYAGDLRAHTSPNSPRGRLYSIHTPGLPVLIAPAYALAGYRGARAVMAMLAAFAAFLVHRLARQLFPSAGTATIAWAAAAFLPPLPFYAVALYPETAAALAVALFALVPHSGPRTRGAAIAVAAFLPWLHPKLLPLAGIGILLLLVRARGTRERAAALVLPLASIGLLLLYFHATFGMATLGAAYGPGLASDLSLLSIPRGLAALFSDRQFGLLVHAPFWALAFAGLWALARERPRALTPLVLLAAATVAVGAGFSMWWGGACPPTRFLVPVVPLLAVGAARGAVGRRDLAAFLAGASLAVVLLAAAAPRALHNRPDGQSALLRLLAPALDLDQFLPSFVVSDLRPAAPLGLLLGAVVLFGTNRLRLALGATGLSTLLFAWLSGPVLRADRAGLTFLQDWDPARLWSPLGKAFPRGLEIPIPLGGDPWVLERDKPRASARFELPPGRYVVHLRGRTNGLAQTRIEMRSDDLVLAAADGAPGTEAMRLPMLLPVGARRLALVASGPGTIVDSATLEPETVLARGDRSALPWPRSPAPETYRLGTGLVRVTPIDPALPEGDGFRLTSGPARFAVDAPCRAHVHVIIRPLTGLVEWAGRAVPLQISEARLPAGEGFAMGETCVVPVRLDVPGAHIAFGEVLSP